MTMKEFKKYIDKIIKEKQKRVSDLVSLLASNNLSLSERNKIEITYQTTMTQLIEYKDIKRVIEL